MSCLYSSPELKALNCRPWRSFRIDPRARLGRIVDGCRSKPYRYRRPSRSAKTRSPPAGAMPANPSIQPAKTSPVLLRKSSSAIQAFVRFAVTPAAQLLESQSRSLGPAFRNLSSGVALALRTAAVHPYNTGPAPMLWAERSRSRGIFQEVFAFQSGFIAAFFEPPRPVKYRPGPLLAHL